MSIPRNIYKTNDGHYLSISASIPQMAARLFVAIGKPYLNSDNRFNTNEARLNNRQIVDSTVAKWISARSRDEVMKVFSEAGVTVAPLYSISDIIHDQHFIERGVYVEIPDEDHGTIPVHKPVPTLSATPANFWSGAPKLGEHTRDILLSAGFEEIEITSLLDQGSIG